jgi:hypothetical protein
MARSPVPEMIAHRGRRDQPDDDSSKKHSLPSATNGILAQPRREIRVSGERRSAAPAVRSIRLPAFDKIVVRRA